jgi:hypothetical protein
MLNSDMSLVRMGNGEIVEMAIMHNPPLEEQSMILATSVWWRAEGGKWKPGMRLWVDTINAIKCARDEEELERMIKDLGEQDMVERGLKLARARTKS